MIENNICKVCDCIMNPEVVKHINKNAELMQFYYQLVSTYINQKYKIELIEGNI